MRGTILNYTLGVENFDEITLSITVKKIEAFLCFPFLPKIRKFKIVENWAEYIAGLKNFDEIALSLTVKEIEAILCLATSGKKFKNSKWPQFLKNWPKVGIAYCLDSLGVENFDEIALSLTAKEIEAFLCFRIFGENSKIQNGRHF